MILICHRPLLRVSRFRVKAVLIHLLVSALFVAAVCAVALMQWFPYPLFLLDGTWRALLILATVDLLLGPFITLIISSDKKLVKELCFDFSVVLCIQLAALSFGLLQIYDQRVVALVHVENEFHIVAKAATPSEYSATNLPSFKGVQYGMLLHEDFARMSPKDIERTMFNPEKYRALNSKVISKALVPKAYLPKAALTKYGKEKIFKLIVGKQRHGVAVFNNNMELLDIYLANKKN